MRIRATTKSAKELSDLMINDVLPRMALYVNDRYGYKPPKRDEILTVLTKLSNQITGKLGGSQGPPPGPPPPPQGPQPPFYPEEGPEY